ncbi:MAG: cell division topological specificity factor MinE [Clostridia bacterium]|nr:cell division topological specificity factor MinE [Clostridia bacterium]
MKFLKNKTKKEEQTLKSKDAAKERLHLVLMQDRANVSADFLDLMKQEIIEVIKKYIDIDEAAMDVKLTNKENNDGTNGIPALYANIPILNIKDEGRLNTNVEPEIKSNQEEVTQIEEVQEEPIVESQEQKQEEKKEVEQNDSNTENING